MPSVKNMDMIFCTVVYTIQTAVIMTSVDLYGSKIGSNLLNDNCLA